MAKTVFIRFRDDHKNLWLQKILSRLQQLDNIDIQTTGSAALNGNRKSNTDDYIVIKSLNLNGLKSKIRMAFETEQPTYVINKPHMYLRIRKLYPKMNTSSKILFEPPILHDFQ